MDESVNNRQNPGGQNPGYGNGSQIQQTGVNYTPPAGPGWAPPVKHRKGISVLKTAAVAAVSAVLAALLVLLLMPIAFGVSPSELLSGKIAKLKESQQEKADGDTVVKTVSTNSGDVSVEGIAQEVTPSIVNIDIRIRNTGSFFLSTDQEGTGSGVIYKEDGYIITNNHVVENAEEITVTLASGEELQGTVVGTDAESDIAVVKVDKTGLPAIEVGDSDTLVVGQLAVAVGSPYGFEHSVTTGIISALHRSVSASEESGGNESSVLTDLVQTDAAINPGNSGGALCNAEGKLVAINTVIASSSGGSEGVGFAIPINTAAGVADDLIAGRKVSHPYIGVWGQSISKSIAKQYDLPVEEGAFITAVVNGGPAEKAGLKQGDIVIEAGGEKVESMDDLISQIRKNDIGEKLKVTYVNSDSGDKKTVEVSIEEDPGR